LGREAFEALLPYFERVLTGERVHYERETNFLGIGKRWTSATHTPTFDRIGAVNGWVAVVLDITAQKRAEDALRKSEERFRLAAQAGRMYAYEWDVTNDVLVRSPEYVKILGVTEPQRFTLQQLMGRIHPDDRPRCIAAIAGVTPENPTRDVTYRVLLPTGAVVWLKNSGRAFFDTERRMLRVIGMVADVTDQKLSEEKLREYEKAVEGLEEMIVVIDREYRYLVANRKFLTMRHLTKEQVVGRFAHEVVNKEAFEAIVKEKLDECFRGKAVRYEMKYTYPVIGERDILVSYFPIEGPSGFDRAACIFQDITERKLAEEALSGMSRKLVEAQEQERARVARELHDDINQRLAMLAIQADHLQEDLRDSPTAHGRLSEFHQQIVELSTAVQSISHQLHSPQLEHLGIVVGMRSLCRDFGARQMLEIDFEADEIYQPVSQQVSLCLFRVLQEALHNAVKHSETRLIKVRLRFSTGQLRFTISDTGKGFDDAAMPSSGLGLVSMRERVRLINGTISIESKPGWGTTIDVYVPLAIPETASERATA
jgi:PAS domain S-box-containing protein